MLLILNFHQGSRDVLLGKLKDRRSEISVCTQAKLPFLLVARNTYTLLSQTGAGAGFLLTWPLYAPGW